MQCPTLNIHFHPTNLFILLKISSFFYVCGPTFFCLKYIIFCGNFFHFFHHFFFVWQRFVSICIPERPPCPLWLSTGYLLLKFKGAKNWLPTYTHTHTHPQTHTHTNTHKNGFTEMEKKAKALNWNWSLIADFLFSCMSTKPNIKYNHPQNVFSYL